MCIIVFISFDDLAVFNGLVAVDNFATLKGQRKHAESGGKWCVALLRTPEPHCTY